ncbi:uncharacterized protein L201_002226 [Kwoniella dendrophila CBS 6074]|uniref:Uncharacterized protein n=1 Tax=Kwoniella dendrophila CBS 6074 TaxID=1295534 RepID=A0AAX4JPK9_9TREE
MSSPDTYADTDSSVHYWDVEERKKGETDTFHVRSVNWQGLEPEGRYNIPEVSEQCKKIAQEVFNANNTNSDVTLDILRRQIQHRLDTELPNSGLSSQNVKHKNVSVSTIESNRDIIAQTEQPIEGFLVLGSNNPSRNLPNRSLSETLHPLIDCSSLIVDDDDDDDDNFQNEDQESITGIKTLVTLHKENHTKTRTMLNRLHDTYMDKRTSNAYPSSRVAEGIVNSKNEYKDYRVITVDDKTLSEFEALETAPIRPPTMEMRSGKMD